MNCQHVEERLSDYMEGLVSRRAAGEIKTHLDSCPACRRLREEHLSLGSLLQKLGREMPPPASDLERWSVQRWLAAKGGKGVAPRVRSGHGSVWRLAAGMCGMAIVAGALSLGVGRWRSGGGAGPWAGHHHTAGAQGTQHAELIPAPTPGPSPNNWGRGDWSLG
jgi:anti-sigma factor RsiW